MSEVDYKQVFPIENHVRLIITRSFFYVSEISLASLGPSSD